MAIKKKSARQKPPPSKIAQRAAVAVKSRKATAPKRREITAAERHRLAGIKRLAAASGPAQILRIPITNVLDGSDYSATLYIGSNQAPAAVILDTGSSTLAVDPSAYDGRNDRNLQTSTYGQLVTYGTGGWAGPVVNTSLSFGDPRSKVTLDSAPIAIASVQQPGNFEGVKGIMGKASWDSRTMGSTPLMTSRATSPSSGSRKPPTRGRFRARTSRPSRSASTT
jgi:hypothetical protein